MLKKILIAAITAAVLFQPVAAFAKTDATDNENNKLMTYDEQAFNEVYKAYMNGKEYKIDKLPYYKLGEEKIDDEKNIYKLKYPIYGTDEALEKEMEVFNDKYRDKKQYDFITDMDYYKDMSNITFDKVNNSKTLVSMLHTSSLYGADYYFNKDHGKVLAKDLNHLEYSPYYEIIWRPDFEKQFVDKINKLREEKGLNKLKVNKDLWAVAKYSSRQNYYGYATNTRNTLAISPYFYGILYQEKPIEWYKENNIDSIELSTSVGNAETGYIPWIDKECETLIEKDKDKNIHVEGQKYYEFFWENSRKYVDFEKNYKKYFDLKDNVKYINFNTICYYDVDSMLKDLFNGRLPDADPQVHMFKSLDEEKTLMDENLKNIGVGVVYRKPIHPNEINGVYSVVILVD